MLIIFHICIHIYKLCVLLKSEKVKLNQSPGVDLISVPCGEMF